MSKLDTLKAIFNFKAYTPVQKNMFMVSYEDGFIKCTTPNNSVIRFNENADTDNLKGGVIADSIKFLSTKHEKGIKVGSTQSKPENNTFELFLREYGSTGKLGSYFPAVLEHIGIAETYKNGSSTWIRISPDYNS